MQSIIFGFWNICRNFIKTIIRVTPSIFRGTGRALRTFWRNHKNVRRGVGVILILTGFIGFAVPVVPGVVFVFIGLEILGFRILFWERIKAWLLKNSLFLWAHTRIFAQASLRYIRRAVSFIGKILFQKKLKHLSSVTSER